jgi:hypothetical protein
MCSQLNNLDPSDFTVPASQRYMALDGPRTSGQLFGDPSTAVAPPGMNDLESWAQELSANTGMQRSDANGNDSAISAFSSDHTSHAAPPFMETTGHSMSMPELSTEMFGDDLTFLEDILLPEFVFSATGFTTPVPSDLERIATQPVPTANDDDISQPGLFLPRLPPSDERSADQLGKSKCPHLFDISASDVEQFRKSIINADINQQLTDFPFPKRSRILRCLSAYFDHLDPHMPIIQHATFSLSGTAPALVLAILALGAIVTSEHQFATLAYEAACTLLNEKAARDNQGSAAFAFWPIQTVLLCVHFGAFNDNVKYRARSQQHFSTVSKMLRLGLGKLKEQRSAPTQDWTSWSFIETFARLASWSCAMSAILLAHDDSFHIKAPLHLRHVPLPLEEDLWRARSAQKWSSLGATPHRHSNLDFLSLAESLFQGEPILDKISCFGLFALIGWILLYICNHERVTVSVGSLDFFEADFMSKIDKGLGAWETLTRRHLRTGQIMFQELNPLISDSFPLLGMAYYHLYVGEELRALKELAGDHTLADGTLTAKKFPGFSPRPSVYKAVRYAANSWLVRSKLGISHFQQSPDPYGCHGATGSYEAGKCPLLSMPGPSHLIKRKRTLNANLSSNL